MICIFAFAAVIAARALPAPIWQSFLADSNAEHAVHETAGTAEPQDLNEQLQDKCESRTFTYA